MLYFAAGVAVFPFVSEFYADKPLPTVARLAGMQFFRGVLYGVFALPFAIWMSGQRLYAGLLLGAAFSILGGIAPLLISNEYMPPHIRLAHAVEIGVSNFIFGVLAVLLLVERKTRLQSVETVHA